MKRPLTSQETVNLLDVIYNGEKYYTGRDLTEYKNRKKRDIALFTAYLGTGCRVSELINLDIRDVCFDTSSFVVTRKGGDEQEIFMPVQVENELFTYMQERVENEKAKDDALFISRLGTRMTAHTITPAAKPASERCTKSPKDFFIKNTQAAPSVVPKKGIMIPMKVSIRLTAFALQRYLFLR